MSQRESTQKSFQLIPKRVSIFTVDASAQEAQIDVCVYHHYGFTDEEITIVEIVEELQCETTRKS